LTKTFINLEDTDPYSVVKAFIEMIHDFQFLLESNSEEKEDKHLNIMNDVETVSSENQDEDYKLKQKSVENAYPKIKSTTTYEVFDNLLHVIHFCHLCLKGMVTFLSYSLSTTKEMNIWIKSLILPVHQDNKPLKRPMILQEPTKNSDDEDSTSPDQKVSQKDHYLINMMLKIHNTILECC
jgi:hypothetical protein